MRRLLALVLATFGLVASLLVVAAPANADSAAYDFLSRVNSSRKSHGLRPLAMKSDLVSVASRWTARMAADSELKHNPNLTSEVKNWKSVGENVGVGPDVASIQQAFMNSSAHRANILDADYTEVGIATVRDSSGELWVTQDFRQPRSTSTSSGSTAPRTTAPKTTTTHPTTTAPRRVTSTRPTGTVSHTTPARQIVHAPVHTAPTLAQRIAALHRAPLGVDPVARAVDYATVMGSLNS